MYLNSGMGDDTGTALAWNSTKYPGVCKPSNAATLAVFKNLQTQLNRAAQAKGVAKISVDGDIGPGTIALMAKVLGTSSSLACTTVAAGAAAFAATAAGIAAAGNVPVTISQPVPVKAPTLVDAAGKETLAPASSGSGIAASLASQWGSMSTPVKLAAVGILGGIGYFAYKELKKS